MATLQEAIAANAIVAFQVPDWEPRQPLRLMWVTPALLSWADDTPALHNDAHSVGGRTLFEHLLTMFCDFRCAERCPPHATRHGIWKMHPPKLRVYGWCPGQHQFVAVTAALESDTKSDKNLNERKMREVREFLTKHKLEKTVLRGDVLAIFPHTT
jgi:hypothetical protein